MTRLVAILGPTGAGKSALAMNVAERTGAEILSVDSMQVYRGLDIGTAKPTPEEQGRVRHHMIDVVEPEVAYSVADFRNDARRVLAQIGDQPVLVVGGSGLHFRALVDPMTFRPADAGIRADLDELELAEMVNELLKVDPAAGTHVDLVNRRRVQRSLEAWRTAGITPSSWAARPEAVAYRNYRPEIEFDGFVVDRSDIDRAIEIRLDEMWRLGLVDEVRKFAPRLGPTARQGVGYRQLLSLVRGQSDTETARDEVRRATIGLVKRQRTFFRRDPRLRWLHAEGPDTLERVMEALS